MKNKGMYLGHFTYKDGGLVRMDPGGPTKKQAAANLANNQQQAKSWDPNQTYGYQEEPLNYNAKTGEYTNWKGQVVRVETKPMTVGSPKSAPTKTKAQIEQEKTVRYDKKTKADPTAWLQEHPDYVIGPNGAPIKRSMMEQADPETLNKLDVQTAKEDFVKDLNSDPLQQSLGTASLDNPVTNQAAGNYANYTVNNTDPRWATDKMLSGNAAPTTADYYRPHDATLGFGIPAAAVMAPIVAEGAIAAAPMIGEGFQAAKTVVKPGVDAWNATMGRKLLGDAGIYATEGQQILSNLATPANLLKTWGLYDATTKYAPEAFESGQMYSQTGDTKYLKDMLYNTGKAALELGSHTGPIVHEVQAAKKPISFIDDASKMLDSDKTIADRGASGFKTFKNAMGYLKQQGGDISVPNLKRVKIKALPKNWKSQ